jgi:MoxR-like ATPase
MDEERMVVSKLEGSYEKVNQVVSVEQILRAQRVQKYTWMKNREIHYMCFATPRKI